MRIDKIVSAAGKGSRKDVTAMIRSGRITVDGAVVKSVDIKVDPDHAQICLDGERLKYEKYCYIMMNKPGGYVSSTDDPRDKTVLQLLSGEYAKLGLFPAGRLDKDAEGLLILTNDGEYCHNVISPKKNVYKKYYAEVSGNLDENDVQAFDAGIETKGGTSFLPGKLIVIDRSSCFVLIREGKYHQVKRMLASLGKPVTYLKRVSIGMLKLDENLKSGAFRKMTKEEADLVFSPCEDVDCTN